MESAYHKFLKLCTGEILLQVGFPRTSSFALCAATDAMQFFIEQIARNIETIDSDLCLELLFDRYGDEEIFEFVKLQQDNTRDILTDLKILPKNFEWSVKDNADQPHSSESSKNETASNYIDEETLCLVDEMLDVISFENRITLPTQKIFKDVNEYYPLLKPFLSEIQDSHHFQKFEEIYRFILNSQNSDQRRFPEKIPTSFAETDLSNDQNNGILLGDRFLTLNSSKVKQELNSEQGNPLLRLRNDPKLSNHSKNNMQKKNLKFSDEFSNSTVDEKTDTSHNFIDSDEMAQNVNKKRRIRTIELDSEHSQFDISLQNQPKFSDTCDSNNDRQLNSEIEQGQNPEVSITKFRVNEQPLQSNEDKNLCGYKVFLHGKEIPEYQHRDREPFKINDLNTFDEQGSILEIQPIPRLYPEDDPRNKEYHHQNYQDGLNQGLGESEYAQFPQQQQNSNVHDQNTGYSNLNLYHFLLRYFKFIDRDVFKRFFHYYEFLKYKLDYQSVFDEILSTERFNLFLISSKNEKHFDSCAESLPLAQQMFLNLQIILFREFIEVADRDIHQDFLCSNSTEQKKEISGHPDKGEVAEFETLESNQQINTKFQKISAKSSQTLLPTKKISENLLITTNQDLAENSMFGEMKDQELIFDPQKGVSDKLPSKINDLDHEEAIKDEKIDSGTPQINSNNSAEHQGSNISNHMFESPKSKSVSPEVSSISSTETDFTEMEHKKTITVSNLTKDSFHEHGEQMKFNISQTDQNSNIFNKGTCSDSIAGICSHLNSKMQNNSDSGIFHNLNTASHSNLMSESIEALGGYDEFLNPSFDPLHQNSGNSSNKVELNPEDIHSRGDSESKIDQTQNSHTHFSKASRIVNFEEIRPEVIDVENKQFATVHEKRITNKREIGRSDHSHLLDTQTTDPSLIGLNSGSHLSYEEIKNLNNILQHMQEYEKIETLEDLTNNDANLHDPLVFYNQDHENQPEMDLYSYLDVLKVQEHNKFEVTAYTTSFEDVLSRYRVLQYREPDLED